MLTERTNASVIASCVRLRNIVPLYRLSNPPTSEMAAAQVAQYSDSQATAVLYCLVAVEPRGMTYDEMEKWLGMRSAKQRLSDLKRAGLVEGTDETRTTRWGAQAEVYRPVAEVLYQVVGHEQRAFL